MTATERTGGRPRGRPRQFDRDDALRRAMEVFWQRGYDGASITELAGAMRINPPSLYAAFGSKEAMFRESVALYTTLEDHAQRAFRDAPSTRAAIETMLRDNADMYTDPDKPSGCLVVLGATMPTPTNASVRDFLSTLRRQNRQAIHSRLEQGIAAGDVAPDIDLDAVAAYYHTILEGLALQARTGTTRETMHATIDCAMTSWDTLQG